MADPWDGFAGTTAAQAAPAGGGDPWDGFTPTAAPVTVPVGRKFEVAHKAGKPNEPVRTHPLRTIGDVLAAPMSLAGAAWESVPRTPLTSWMNAPTHPSGNHFARALRIATHTPGGIAAGLHALNEEYDPVSDATLAREGRDPAKVHPLAKAGAEFAVQWWNPTNAAVGVGARMLGRGAKAAREASPFIDDTATIAENLSTKPFGRAMDAAARGGAKVAGKAVGAAAKAPVIGGAVQAGRELVSRYAPLRERGGTPYVAAGLAAQAAPEHAAAHVLKDTRDRFGGLTRAQKIEVQKLSYVDEEGKPLYTRSEHVAEPAKGPSLAERARNVRADLQADDARQAALGIRDPEKGEMFASGTFYPMRKFGDRPVYATPKLDAAAREGHEVPVNAFPSGGGRRSRFSAGVPKVGSKYHPTIIPPDVEAALSPEFDAAHQYQMHRMETNRAIANEEARRQLETVQGLGREGVLNTVEQGNGVVMPAMARMPLRYALDRPAGELELGFGEEGKKGMNRYIDATSRAMARKAAREDPNVVAAAEARGISPFMLGSRKIVDRNLAPYEARAREANDALGRISKAQTKITAYAGRSHQTVGDELLRQVSAQSTEVDRLNAAIAQAQGAAARGERAADARSLTEIVTLRDAAQQRLTAARERAARRAEDAKVPPSTKSYTRLFNLLDELPKGLAGRVRPLLEAAGERPTAESVADAAHLLRSSNAPAARAMLQELGRLPKASRRVPGGPTPEQAAAAVPDTVGPFTNALGKVAQAGRNPIADAALGPVKKAAAGMERRVGSETESLYRRRDRLTGPMNAAARQATALERKQSVVLDKARQKAATTQSTTEMAQIYRATFDRLYADVRRDVQQRVESEAPRAPYGYTRESALGLGSPTGREMALDDSFATFFKGAERTGSRFDSEKARGFWHAQQVMNRLARASIVAIPVVHAVNNLGMHYLAEGGDPETMARILARKATFDPELEARAAKSGAVNEFAGHLFGGQDAHAATTERGELASEAGAKAGPFAKAVTPIARGAINAVQGFTVPKRVPLLGGRELGYAPMNDWLFNGVERDYAIDLFRRFTAQGATDGAAAIRVRQALGKYGDVSPREAQANLDRLFYFYPWAKTVVPFWVKKGTIDPKWWQAPERAIQVNNEAQGYDDPSHPFTATLGRFANGDFRRVVAPIPQRVLEPIGSLARAPLDAVRGSGDVWDDLKRPADYLAGHLSLPLALGRDAIDQVSAHALGHAAAPWNTFQTSPGATPGEAALEIGSKLAGHAFAPIATAEHATQDPLGILTSTVFGGFSYGHAPAEKAARQHAVRASFASALAGARRAHNVALERELLARERERLRAVDELFTARGDGAAQGGIPPLPVP